MIRLLFLLLLLTVYVPLLAQSTTNNRRWHTGPTVGLNVANTSANQLLAQDNRYGYNVGVKGTYVLGRRLLLNGLLVYSQKGAKGEYGYWRDEYNYLELPVLLGYRMGREAVQFYPMVGVQQGYLLSTRIEPSALSRPSSEIYRYELGISAGVGSSNCRPKRPCS